MSAATARWDTIRRLHRARPRSRLLRASAVALGALVLWAWLGGEIQLAELFSARRRANLGRCAPGPRLKRATRAGRPCSAGSAS